MSNIITVKFFDKEYTVPEDVLLYIDFLSFTDSVRDSLLASFIRKIKSNVECIEDENFLVQEIEQQVGRFISKLCDYDIFTRTISDYLKDNKGYELFLQTKQKVISQIIAIRSEKLEVYKAGVEDAISRKDSSVTGLDFSIISSSFVNHMIYAYMDASEQTKQERKALETYNREIAELNRQVQTYDRQESSYISGNVIPAMNTVFTFFASELLHRFIADLIDAEKFDRAALKYIDMDRSNDLLKNLALSKNKSAVIENAFVACPFNAEVYMQALENNLLDSDSFQTAKIFKQGEKIISFLRENWGKVSFPDKFQINYQRVELLAAFTGEDTTDLLHLFTEQFAISVVSEYSRVASMIPDNDLCQRIMADFDETAILSGEAISKGKAFKYVNPIVTSDVWKQLTTKCGHTDLFDKIRVFVPADVEVYTKGDIDRYLIEQLFERFESIRVEKANQITERIQAEERARIEAEEKAREAARIKEERKKAIIAKIKSIQAKVKDLFEKTKKYIPFACIGIVVLVIAIFIINNVIIPDNKYRSAVELMESENYGDASDIFLSLGGYKDADELLAECEHHIQVEAYDEIYNEAVAFMNSGMYREAIAAFAILNGYKDSADRISNCQLYLNDMMYSDAIAMIADGDYESAYKTFELLGDYKDSKSQLQHFKVLYKEERTTNYVGNWTGTYLYSYDSYGRLLVKEYNNGTMVYNYTYSGNNLVSMVLVMDSGKTSRTDYYYDGSLLIRAESTSLQGEFSTTDYHYESGLLKKTIKTDDDGSYEITTFFYNDTDQLIKEHSQLVNEFHSEKFPYETNIEYTYDDSGNLVAETWTFDSGDTSVVEYVYDTYGYPIKEIHSDGRTVIEYEYDINHYLVTRKKYSDGEVAEITEYIGHIVFYNHTVNE